MVEVKCKRCGRSWKYGGENKYWAQCPDCKISNRLALFRELEKTKLTQLEDELNYLDQRFSSLHDFVTEKNPQLLVEWKERLVSEAKEKVDQQIKEVFNDNRI